MTPSRREQSGTGGGHSQTVKRTLNRTAVVRLAVVALVVLSSLGAFAVPVAGDDSTVLAVETAATPERPLPSENLTVETTVDSLVDGAEMFTVHSVAVRNGTADDSQLYNRTEPGRTVNGNETVAFHNEVDLEQTGSHDLYVHLKLYSRDGEVFNLVRPLNVTVAEPHPALTLSGDRVGRDGQTTFTLSLVNGNQERLRGLEVDLASDDVALDDRRFAVPSVPAGNETTLTVDARDATPGRQTVTAEVSYFADDDRRRTVTRTLQTRLDGPGDRANVTLTGLRVSREAGAVVVRGSASNVGGTNASGVLIDVGDSDRVAPATDQSSYFVGEVSESDYASFQVRADVTGNETVEIPLRISYSVEDRRYQRTVTVSYEPPQRSAPSDSGGGFPVPLALGAGVVLVGGVAVTYRRLG